MLLVQKLIKKIHVRNLFSLLLSLVDMIIKFIDLQILIVVVVVVA